MTVIAYRRTNEMHILAADRCGSSSDTEQVSTKIWKVDGVIIATNGNAAAGQLMKQWFLDGEDLSKWPTNQADKDDWASIIICRPSQRPYWYETLPMRMPIEAEYRAWGCGRDAALGALYVGASATKAVEAANAHISGCGFGIDTYSVPA